MFLAGVGEPSGRAFHRAFHVPGPVLVPAPPSRRSAWVDDLRSCFIVGWRPEPCPACSRSGVAFWVAYPERPGAGRMCAPGVPWPTQVWVPGRDTPVRDSGPVGVSRQGPRWRRRKRGSGFAASLGRRARGRRRWPKRKLSRGKKGPVSANCVAPQYARITPLAGCNLPENGRKQQDQTKRGPCLVWCARILSDLSHLCAILLLLLVN
eukprot:CAMPEP_0172180092 /NCGR_PEP_ID=MMETSP1050-20130122/17006_1 /TAXON_ID=233186 /ORGANISM="Cryptomonas curvata, Strain CCAP979/52" /LENGTH=207 /DNA_ID=CAMNT_0012853097 /DNA_START=422 /DNA_END=1045 /DNA_ORIENTATION=+